MITAAEVTVLLSMGVLPNPKKQYCSRYLKEAVEKYNRAYLNLEKAAAEIHMLAQAETVSER